MNTARDLGKAKGLKIVHVNCRSIYGKIDEIRYLFTGIDILACTETWVTEMLPNSMIDLPDMNLYRWDRHNGRPNGVTKTKGVGFACYINNNLNLDCHIMNDFTTTTCDIELLTLRGKYDFGKNVVIMTIYRPPNGSIDNFFKILNNLFDENPLTDNELWLLGDFNIDFLKRHDLNTLKLYEFLRIYGLKQHIAQLKM